MTLLVDTHVVAWLLIESRRVSKRAAQAIKRARRSGSGLAISSFTLYELAQGIHRGRIRIDATLEVFLAEVEKSFAVLQLNAAIAERAVRIGERFPGDPMFRAYPTPQHRLHSLSPTD